MLEPNEKMNLLEIFDTVKILHDKTSSLTRLFRGASNEDKNYFTMSEMDGIVLFMGEINEALFGVQESTYNLMEMEN